MSAQHDGFSLTYPYDDPLIAPQLTFIDSAESIVPNNMYFENWSDAISSPGICKVCPMTMITCNTPAKDWAEIIRTFHKEPFAPNDAIRDTMGEICKEQLAGLPPVLRIDDFDNNNINTADIDLIYDVHSSNVV